MVGAGKVGARTKSWWTPLLTFVFVWLGWVSWALADTQNEPGQRVVVATTEGMIDLGLSPFVERVLETAEEQQAAVVVFEINTFGGRVDAAVAIRDHLLASSVPTVALVNQRAISAGALIALAAEQVAMVPGGTIGAAAPVEMSGEQTAPAGEKTVSYVRKEFRATADARGRPGVIAEAMVDADVVIPDLIEKGKLLTLTTEIALEHEVADFEVEGVSELLLELGFVDPVIQRIELNWAEHVVRFLTLPPVASLLMTLGLLGLLVEIRTPGLGIPGLVGVLCLAAFFGGHALVALVGWEQVLLLVLGVGLLALEVFVLPGFGVAGILGIVALAAGLTTSLVGSGASLSAMVMAVTRVFFSATFALLAALVLLRFLPQLPGGKRLILSTALPSGGGDSDDSDGGRGNETHVSSFVGLTGTAVTPLRPAGIALLGGRRIDVVTEGEFVDSGEPVEVVSQAGHRIVVRLHRGTEST